MRKRQIGRITALFVATVLVVGCSQKPTVTEEAKPAPQPAEHAHVTGPHGGALAEWSDGRYHAELCIDRDKNQATVYVLDGDAKKPVAIKTDRVLVSVKEPYFQIELTASPQAEDPSGKSSRFVGTHKNLSKSQEFAGTISGLVGGTPNAGDFKLRADLAGGKHGMPEGVGGTPAERVLFLTPGGIYSAQDIQKNGNIVPSEKFKGISWPHDDDLKPGDKLCPVTANKADDRCEWIVNGKKYEFCCTPCLDKFVKWAKQDPKKIKEPEAYIHK